MDSGGGSSSDNERRFVCASCRMSHSSGRFGQNARWRHFARTFKRHNCECRAQYPALTSLLPPPPLMRARTKVTSGGRISFVVVVVVVLIQFKSWPRAAGSARVRRRRRPLKGFVVMLSFETRACACVCVGSAMQAIQCKSNAARQSQTN